MLSTKTLLELIKLADKLTHPEINRIVSIFNFTPIPPGEKNTVMSKTTKIFNDLRYYPETKTGPFTNDIQLDFLQYLIDDYFDKRTDYENGLTEYNPNGPSINFKNAFVVNNKELGNSLKRDGYIVEEKAIKKLLPAEIEEAKTESELFLAIDKYNFQVSKGHLVQAISNHSQGNWASANSQFRTFTESLLTEINNFLLPGNQVTTAAQAIKMLAETANPPFLSKDLNEYPNNKDADSFVYGLWIRLHPDGSHPGLSDEDDSSFRYHISIVFANYLLRRLAERKKVSA
ncbi:MAG: hypothetical protein JWQ09_5179 [Segetibacter sp.]|nr:hypothetical protein [Segetibacter sp.]